MGDFLYCLPCVSFLYLWRKLRLSEAHSCEYLLWDVFLPHRRKKKIKKLLLDVPFPFLNDAHGSLSQQPLISIALLFNLRSPLSLPLGRLSALCSPNGNGMRVHLTPFSCLLGEMYLWNTSKSAVIDSRCLSNVHDNQRRSAILKLEQKDRKNKLLVWKINNKRIRKVYWVELK